MDQNQTEVLQGGCTCGEIRYRLSHSPIVTHACHCSWCQRESGAAFALNAMIESAYLTLLSGKPVMTKIPSNSGKGQTFARCPNCQVAVWSHYVGAGDVLSFVRVGTLDQPESCPPDMHIYTGSKLSWVILPSQTPAFKAFYKRSEQLSAAALERLSNLRNL